CGRHSRLAVLSRAVRLPRGNCHDRHFRERRSGEALLAKAARPGEAGYGRLTARSGHERVTKTAKRDYRHGVGAAIDDVPRAVAPHGEVGFAIAVVISLHRDIALIAPPLHAAGGPGGAVNHVPVAIRRAPHGEIGFTVAVVVAGNRNISRLAPRLADGGVVAA